MHRDEGRDPALLEQQLSADFVSDPAASYRKYRGMAARVKQVRRELDALRREQTKRSGETGRLQRQHRSLEERNARLQEHNDRLRDRIAVLGDREERFQSRIERLEQQNAALKDRAERWKGRATVLQERMSRLPEQGEDGSPSLADLTRAKERLAEAKQRVADLEEELAQLRGGRTSLAGALVTGSVQTGTAAAPETEAGQVRHEAGDPDPAAEVSDDELRKQEPEGDETTADAGTAAVAAASSVDLGPPQTAEQAPPSAKRPLAELHTFDELYHQMAQEPTLEVLHGALLRAWYHDGEVARALHLLAEHPDLAEQLNRPGRLVAERIRGFDRLASRAARWIPPRSSGPAYVPERDRVLYCVHSTPVYQSNGYSTRTRGVAQAIRAAGS